MTVLTITITTILWQLHRRILLEQSFTAHMLLLTAASAFRSGRRC